MSAIKEQFSDNHPLTKLIPDLSRNDPDDAFSSIPYEKVGDFFDFILLRIQCCFSSRMRFRKFPEILMLVIEFY